MTSFNYLAAVLVVIFVYFSTATFGHGNSTSQTGNNTGTVCNINTKAVHGTSNSTVCKRNLQIVDDVSKFEDVLHFMREPTTNIVEITVSVVSGNKTRFFPEMKWPWASEIGRNIISLVKRAKDSIFSSPVFTVILEVGIEKVGIQVMEKNGSVGCLPPGDKGSDMVFDFLLDEIFSHTKDDEDAYYKLCRPYKGGSLPFNCCRITGGRNLPICADYSSVVLTYARPAIIVVFLISFFIVLPFELEHIISYPTVQFYKTSDSRMSLISIVSMILFEGRGPAKSLFRRCVFAGLSLLVFLPDFLGSLWLKVVFIVWAIFFVLFDDDIMTYVEGEQGSNKPALDEKIISGLKAPFSCFFVDMLKFYQKIEDFILNKCSKCCSCLYGPIVCFIALVYVLAALPCWIGLALLKFTFSDFLLSLVIKGNNSQLSYFECCSNSSPKLLYDVFVGFIAVLYLFIVLPCWIVLRLPFLFILLYLQKKRRIMACNHLVTDCKLLLRLLTFVNIVFFTGMILMFALSIVVGLTINAEYFSPIVAPILTLIVYFWKNWKFSVEEKYLQLKTSLIEVCEEKAAAKEDEQKGHEQPSTHAPSSTDACADTNADNNDVVSGASKTKDFVIIFDKHGEALISKELYEKVSKIILPLDHLLFHFVRRVIFVGLYAFVMFTVMILGQESGVSGSVQVISAIAAALIPFVFDTIFADHHSAQKKAKNMGTKQKLKYMLKINKRESNIIFVELININNNESQGNEQIPNVEVVVNNEENGEMNPGYEPPNAENIEMVELPTATV